MLSEIEFKTTVTLVYSESSLLRKGSSRKTPLLMHNSMNYCSIKMFSNFASGRLLEQLSKLSVLQNLEKMVKT